MTVYGDDYPTQRWKLYHATISTYVILAHAHTLALQYIFDGHQALQTEIFNVGIGNGLTVFEIIKAFEKVSGETLNYDNRWQTSG
jgi:UDP-glucose 4-epimerase